MFAVRDDASETPEVDPGMHWRIKDSFVRYVLRGADGVYSVEDGAADDGRGNFLFPLARVVREDESWELAFHGDVRFRGHHGALFVPIVTPTVRLSTSGGSLSVGRPRAGDTDDTAVDRLTIAEVEAAEPVPVGDALMWPPLVPRLTPDGVALFGGAYQVGAPLEPVRMIIPAT